MALVSVVAVTRGVALLLLLLLLPLVNAGGEAVGEQDVATVERGVAKKYKMNRQDHRALTKEHLFNKLQYYGDDEKVYELDLVKEVSDHKYYDKMAKKLGLNPNTIVDSYILSEKEKVECSRRLFDMMYETGYNGGFNWDAYIDGLRNTGGLDGIIIDLENMLECNGISRTQDEAVSFELMICDKDKFNLIEAVAPHWEDVARTFGISEVSISFKENIPERAARAVLQRVHDNGYKGQLGWQGVLDLLRDAGANRIYSKLDGALNSVKLLEHQRDEL